MLRRVRTTRVRGSAAGLGLVTGALLLLAGCQQANPPVVKGQTFSAAAGSTKVVAIVPFYPRPELRQRNPDLDSDALAKSVSIYIADALAAQGVRVVPPTDLQISFMNDGRPVPRRDPRVAAEVAARDFGATSVVLGEVIRWRDRDGANLGSGTAASVAFTMRLFEAPGGRRLWTSRFDHTQRTLTADPLIARKYPGGGTRWLTAAELARWGASAAATDMVQGQWRASK
jgi:hypothetical protein